MLALALPILLAAHARAAGNETADYKEVLSQQQTFGDDVDAFDDAQDPFLYAGDSDAYDALAQSGAQYYGDEFETYYADNNAYAADFGGDLPSDAQEMCIEGKDGKANLTGPVCDVTIEGVDKVADLLDGGVDGTYKVSGCHDGRPKYVRDVSNAEGRILWYSKFLKDWEITRGVTVNMTQEALLVYQHGMHKYSRPDLVPADNWHLNVTHSSQPSGAPNTTRLAPFMQVSLIMKCVKGQKLPKHSAQSPQLRPLLDDEEMTKKYREVHTTYNSQGNPDPTINLGLIFLVIASGMGVVLGIPYMLYGKNSGQAKSWAQQLEDSRKVRVGHVS